MNAWAASLPRSQTDALLGLRDVPNIRVAEHGDRIWLSGPEWSAVVDRLLRGIPDVRRFRWIANGRLVPATATLATELLPELEWSPLRSALTLRFPLAEGLSVAPQSDSTARFGAAAGEAGTAMMIGGETLAGMAPSVGESIERIELRLVRAVGVLDALNESANLVLTTVADWCGFVETSPQAMWEGVAFAVDSSGRCVVLAAHDIGVRGERWRERDGIAAPLGWRWEPAIAPRLLRRFWLLADGDVALWFPENQIERIEAASFVRASRSAVRESRRQWLSANAPSGVEG